MRILNLIFISLTLVCSSLGDINRDGEVGFQDIPPFIKLLTEGKYQVEADFNQDSKVNFLDIAGFTNRLGEEMECSVEQRVCEVLYVSAGESNSGGLADNNDLSPAQLVPNPCFPLIEANSLTWQPMHTGVNNNTGHFGIVSPSTHAWEVGLAGITCDDPTIEGHLVQTGQGGSRVRHWTDPSDPNYAGYVGALTARLDAAKSTTFDEVVFWVTLGVNDAADGTSVTDYVAGVTAYFNLLRMLCPNANIVFAESISNSNTALVNQYNAEILQMSQANSWLHFVETSDLTGFTQGSHWDSVSYEILSQRMFDAYVPTK